MGQVWIQTNTTRASPKPFKQVIYYPKCATLENLTVLQFYPAELLANGNDKTWKN